jgi:hypothetical protein
MDDEVDDIFEEAEILFLPRSQALEAQGITVGDFEAALLAALEERETMAARSDVSDDDFPPLEEMPLNIGGVTYMLEDLAEVQVRGLEG